jgi:hypothetical protein
MVLIKNGPHAAEGRDSNNAYSFKRVSLVGLKEDFKQGKLL